MGDKYSDMSTDELDRVVTEKENFYRRVINLAGDALSRFGEVTYREVLSDHTKVKRRLEDFYGFTLIGDYGQTVMGGNDIYVEKEGKVVLHLSFQTTGDTPTVIEISDPELWEHDMAKMTDKPRKCIEMYADLLEREKRRKENEMRSEAEETERRSGLVEKAEKLKI